MKEKITQKIIFNVFSQSIKINVLLYRFLIM